jgi:hypothetical protein
VFGKGKKRGLGGVKIHHQHLVPWLKRKLVAFKHYPSIEGQPQHIGHQI